MILTITFDPTSQLGVGTSKYIGLEPKLAANEVACTADQFAAPGKWKLDGDGKTIVAATEADLAPTLAQLTSALVVAASAACDVLTRQVVPDQVHQNAYVNAAAMVGPGAVVPTAEPTKSAFAAMASSFGAEPAAFAAMVVAIAAVSWQLQAAQVTVTKAATAAKTAADLTAALAAFEATLAAIVAAISTAGVTVTAPAPIAIAGL